MIAFPGQMLHPARDMWVFSRLRPKKYLCLPKRNTLYAKKKVPINTIATSHMARRTFIGNIYKKVKDPNLVASLTGHTEGSKAFSRYRDIDTEMKKELVGLLD